MKIVKEIVNKHDIGFRLLNTNHNYPQLLEISGTSLEISYFEYKINDTYSIKFDLPSYSAEALQHVEIFLINHDDKHIFLGIEIEEDLVIKTLFYENIQNAIENYAAFYDKIMDEIKHFFNKLNKKYCFLFSLNYEHYLTNKEE